MPKEQNYDFRKRLDRVHKPDICDRAKHPEDTETVLDAGWKIVYDGLPERGTAAYDLRDYLQIGMDIGLAIGRTAGPGEKAIVVNDDAGDRGFDLDVTENAVVVSGNTRRGIHFLEDVMNLREAPFLPRGHRRSDPVFTPRMVHSGWAHDIFPDSHLDAIAHAGFDAILLYVTGPDRTTQGYCDFNDLIDRAARYGLDVYFYSYLNSFKHPLDPDAEAFFDANFGAVFRCAPRARGLILVGESCAFPSKDPRSGTVKADGLRPRAGFFPADDYPQWLDAVKKAVRRYSPDADVVFWTYNWGNHPPEERLPLLERLPDDVSVQVTFEMFEQIRYPNHTMKVPDYTITFPGPGRYFTSEAEVVHRRGMKLFTITNTGGRTWDCGVVPYIPVPQQWFKRFRSMLEAHEKWGLSGIMDSHHFGWFPNPVLECARWCFNTPSADPEEILRKIAVRDFGAKAADDVIAGWRLWSDAVDSYTPGFDDQAGPLRVGPAYPFYFYPVLYPFVEQDPHFPFPAHAYRGERNLNTVFRPEHVLGHTFWGRRVREDLRIMAAALDLWRRGEETMDRALAKVPEKKREEAARQIGVGKFFGLALRTTLNMKKWYLANRELEVTGDFDRALAIMDELVRILEDERRGVLEAIELAEADSSLGWEPSMEYCADPEHLKWKLEKLERLLKYVLPRYRETIRIF